MSEIEFLEALKSFIKWLAWMWVIGFIFIQLLNSVFAKSPLARDDSDEKGWGERSEMKITTDYKTGLQYLSNSKGGITPRLDADGKQMMLRDYHR